MVMRVLTSEFLAHSPKNDERSSAVGGSIRRQAPPRLRAWRATPPATICASHDQLSPTLLSAWSIASTACAISNYWSSNGRSSKLAAGFVFALIVISFPGFCTAMPRPSAYWPMHAGRLSIVCHNTPSDGVTAITKCSICQLAMVSARPVLQYRGQGSSPHR